MATIRDVAKKAGVGHSGSVYVQRITVYGVEPEARNFNGDLVHSCESL
jgi:hypothetical protein